MLLRLYEHLKLPEGKYIPFFGKYWYFMLCKLENRYIRRVKLPEHVLNKEPRKEKVIASLTSFPARINSVYLAVKSLMLQDYKPDEIILWLSKEQFEGIEIPENLRELEKRGLQIKYCDDLRGHKKYFELIKTQKPDELILTFDDDIIYPPDSISKVIKYHKLYPKAIITNRGYEIMFFEDGNLTPHLQWIINSDYGVGNPEKLIYISGGSGPLFPYNSLHPDVTREDYIQEYAISVDDLWITVMAILNNTDIVKTTRHHKTYTTLQDTQQYQLALENIKCKKNEIEIDKYDELLSKLRSIYLNFEKMVKDTRK